MKKQIKKIKENWEAKLKKKKREGSRKGDGRKKKPTKKKLKS